MGNGKCNGGVPILDWGMGNEIWGMGNAILEMRGLGNGTDHILGW